MTMHHRYDAVIVGAGGAGLMAALQVAPHAHVAVLTKLYPTRSHTGAAQGGIGAALGNLEEDSWLWHAFDTVKGSDYLADQDAVEILAREAIETVYDLEHWGLPFSRTPEGQIAQRPFGGHTRNFGEAPVRRACYAADRTGHMILQTLYQQCIRHEVSFFNEFQVLDVIVEDGICKGVIAFEIATGEVHIFQSKAVLFATGGYGRIFKITSNAHALTGDGVAIVLRRGLPLEDMEFFQFHPTGIYKLGILLSEAARGEGGVIKNRAGERFMERYAPTLKDLAPRDLISRCIYTEIREGRGIDGKDYVHLDVRHLGREVIDQKLPDITGFVRTYLGIDPVTELVPIQPTAHYAMGGIPTDNDGRVIVDEKNTPLPGFYAAGECACVSVHGANRLGTNSLVDILVFGRRAGRDMTRYIRDVDLPRVGGDADARAKAEVVRILENTGKESVAEIRRVMQEEMMDKASVFRHESDLQRVLTTLRELRERYASVSIHDRGKRFNTDLLEALEIGYLLDLAETLVVGALARQESRGAHYREDFPARDDANWLKHSLIYRTDRGWELRYKPVVITRFEPKERKY
jgi:succinate dehydrogenase / fumarate reductase flavoprotein subunit